MLVGTNTGYWGGMAAANGGSCTAEHPPHKRISCAACSTTHASSCCSWAIRSRWRGPLNSLKARLCRTSSSIRRSRSSWPRQGGHMADEQPFGNL